jgi:hypothetical protein
MCRISTTCFILFEDFKAIDPQYTLGRELTEDDQEEIVLVPGERTHCRFCGICERSSFPEFGRWF